MAGLGAAAPREGVIASRRGGGRVLRVEVRADPRLWLVVAVLAIGGLLPLRWYLGLSEGYDERFAWRMFSPERMVRCKVAFLKDEEPIALYSRFHEAWITTLKRGRLSTARAMARRLCEEEGPPIEIRWVCREVDGTQRDFGSQGEDLCGGW